MMRPEITIIGTGSEITSGKSIDTNSGWIANELFGLGFHVSRFIVLPDNPGLIKEEIRRIMKLPGKHFILMTGGLGPTEDDYTLEVICGIGNCKPVKNQKAYEKLKFVYESRGKTHKDILQIAERQTFLPENSILLENDNGIAPGFICTLDDNCRIAAFPGVPQEMKPMFRDRFVPEFRKIYSSESIYYGSRFIWWTGESLFQEKFISKYRDLIGKGILWGVTAKRGYIKVNFQSPKKELIDEIISLTNSEFPEIVSGDIFADIHSLLTGSKLTLATAESCTGGLIAKIITDTPGSSEYFLGSIVSYHNDIKANLLDVSKETLAEHGAVSMETAKEMAEGLEKKMNSDYSISVTGIAGPGGGSREKKQGLVFIGIKKKNETAGVQKFNFPFTREIFRENAANSALFLLYKLICRDQK
ncbi:MAG: nicotinamide-nucleotide amidohydrolase family protein [Leptospira sp.]|nr:nicotinamide-nucleotide amidohydrolase family protein [Leptospira sp.]